MDTHARGLDGLLAARPVVVGITVLNVVLLATMGWLLSTRNAATQVDRAAVLAGFRANASLERTTSAPSTDPTAIPAPSATPEATSPAVTGPIAPATAPSPTLPAPEPSTAPEPSPTPETARTSPTPTSPTPTSPTPTATPVAGYTLPDSGVYTYDATGHETVSVLSGRHDYPSQVFASVTSTGGCGWRMELQVLREHVDTWDMCGLPGELARTGHSRTIEFFGQRNHASYDCGEPVVHDGPGVVPGRTRTWQHCDDGPDDRADIDVTLLERGTFEVAGTQVPAIAVEVVMRFSGGTEGVARDHYWLAADTGLLLRLDRTVESTSSTSMGSADYREQATFVLTSLTPAT